LGSLPYSGNGFVTGVMRVFLMSKAYDERQGVAGRSARL